jgi:hypothetical protein
MPHSENQLYHTATKKDYMEKSKSPHMPSFIFLAILGWLYHGYETKSERDVCGCDLVLTQLLLQGCRNPYGPERPLFG